MGQYGFSVSKIHKVVILIALLVSCTGTVNLPVKVKVAQSCLALCSPMDHTVHGILQVKILEWVAFPFSRGSSQPRPPTLQVDSLSAEPQGKPKNTGVSSLSLLQGIFPTQDSNQGLLHCRQILYQLTYQGKPIKGNNICPMHTYMDCNLIHWIISF